jgi:phosphopantothenoylcysteine decarboxylase/phosphopantothenate--cysteine ligase
MNILLGITGSVSAYKTPWLVRDLRKAGHNVRVIMTPSARQFVAPLALEAVSLHPVIIDPYDPSIQEGGSWHVHLAQWADVICIAPCSATTLARLATGLCDTALMTVVCSRTPVTELYVFPAMDTDMWLQPSTKRNVDQLRSDGVIVIDPESGELASGLVGQGRLPEIAKIIKTLVGASRWLARHNNIEARHNILPERADILPERANILPEQADILPERADILPEQADILPERADILPERASHRLAPTSVVITAGPTHERIDAVRSIVNHATGTMGFALAEAAQKRGYLVTLVTGPTSLPTPFGVERIDVVSAQQMYDAVMRHTDSDVFIMAAAVADFTPAEPSDRKIKKEAIGDDLSITLTRTRDILAAVGKSKKEHQRVIGFALESDNLLENAHRKLESKNADMIVANEAGKADSGFGTGQNTITIVTKHAQPLSYPAMSKRACAEVILDALEKL